MPKVYNVPESIGNNYPTETGRLKRVEGRDDSRETKIALLGDSTLDNGYWVDSNKPYEKKSHTVTHQVATALASNPKSNTYDIANFAVDGATTSDLMRKCRLNKVLPVDKDHRARTVHQVDAVNQWQPNIAVLSVAGNNFREALATTLQEHMSYPRLLLRSTPEESKRDIKSAFERVKKKILQDYKKIIDELIENNSSLNRIVLVSQYYPSITELTPYFIYTGFSHLARAQGNRKPPFTVVEETMNELYREILQYALSKDKEIVFVDATSSLNPLGGNHTYQIEPNEQGSAVMGKLIAGAIEYHFPAHNLGQKFIPRIHMENDDQPLHISVLTKKNIPFFGVKKLDQFISENRYRHVGLLFSPKSSLTLRMESAYHVVMGKQFDMDYKGLFAFGLLDASLVSVLAHYLWRFAIDENVHVSLRAISGVVAAPILLTKMAVGLAITAVLGLPVLGYHGLVALFGSEKEGAGPEQARSEEIELGMVPN